MGHLMDKKHFQTLLDNIADIAWLIDDSGLFLVVNKAFLELYQCSISQIIGKSYFDILDHQTATLYANQDKEAIETKQPQKLEAYIELENSHISESRWIETIITPTFDEKTGDCIGVVGVGHDITERKQQLCQLQEQQEWLKVYFELPIIGMAIISKDSNWLNVNEKLCQILGYSHNELIKNTLIDLIPKSYKSEFTTALTGLSNSQLEHVNLELEIYHRNGEVIYVSLIIHLIKDHEKCNKQFVIMMDDITEKRAVEQKLSLANKVIESSSEAIMITDNKSQIVRVNNAFTSLTGYEESDVLGKNPRLLQSGRNTKEFYQSMWADITQEGTWQGEMWDKRKDGTIYPKWINISAIHRPDTQKVSHYVALFSDITERKRAENKIRYMIDHDSLTGLPNRTLLEKRLIRSISDAEVEKNRITLIQIDLDNFKTINDSMGHYVGDQLLKSVATRLQQIFRSSDLVARLGGDEFIVVIEKLSNINIIEMLAENVLKEFKKPFNTLDYTMHITPSIGISTYPDDGENYETLLKNVDTAMYTAKKQGRNQFVFFNKDMSDSVLKRVKLEYLMRTALKEGEFTLAYQPQVDLATHTVVGVEALIRWTPDKVPVSPVDFIPVAEETGLIIPLGEWIIETACQECKALADEGFNINMAVNLSAAQFQEDYLVELVSSTLSKTKLAPQQLDLEITEGMLMHNAGGAIKIINNLKQLGTKVSIDDFGTGYSSLAYLKSFNVDKLKIDRSFVTGLPNDKDDIAITTTIIQLAKSMGLKIVAEGAETEQQVEFLSNKECEQIQGYYFSKPLNKEELRTFLSDWNK